MYKKIFEGQKKGPGGAKINLTKDALIREMLKKPADDIERVYTIFLKDGEDKFLKESDPLTPCVTFPSLRRRYDVAILSHPAAGSA